MAAKRDGSHYFWTWARNGLGAPRQVVVGCPHVGTRLSRTLQGHGLRDSGTPGLAARDSSRAGRIWRSGRTLAMATAIVLGLVFCAAAVGKAWDSSGSRSFLTALGLGPWRSEIVAAAIIAEWAIGAWLLSGWRSRAALGAAVLTLLGLTLVLAYAKMTGASTACGCFGRSNTSVDAAMVRNGTLLVIGAVNTDYEFADAAAGGGNTVQCELANCPGGPVQLDPQYSCVSGQECCGIFSCQTGQLKPGTGFSCCGAGSFCDKVADPVTGAPVSATCEVED